MPTASELTDRRNNAIALREHALRRAQLAQSKNDVADEKYFLGLADSETARIDAIDRQLDALLDTGDIDDAGEDDRIVDLTPMFEPGYVPPSVTMLE